MCQGEGCENKWILYSKMHFKCWLKIVFNSPGFRYYFSLLPLRLSTVNIWPTYTFKLMPLIFVLATRIYKLCVLISGFFRRLCQFRTTWSLKVATQMALLQLLKYKKQRRLKSTLSCEDPLDCAFIFSKTLLSWNRESTWIKNRSVKIWCSLHNIFWRSSCKLSLKWSVMVVL